MSQVDTFGLAKVGSAVSDSAEAFAKAHTSRADQLVAAGALPGWSSGAALDATAQAWGGFLRQLSAQVETLGTELTRTAADFRAADAAAGNRVTAAGHSPVRLY